jgi:integrase/recombinase XerD
MKRERNFPALLECFFMQRLMAQRQVSPHTIRSYRDTFRLLLRYAAKRLHKAPSALALADLDPGLIGAFLDQSEKERGNSARSRNLRLTAIRSFFRYAAFEDPSQSGLIQRVLAMPSKRYEKKLVNFLTRTEIDAVLAAPDRNTWAGRRDHTFLLVAVQTGLRLSEITGLRREDVALGAGAHVHCLGKGRKQRSTPLTKQAANALKLWFQEPMRGDGQIVFPNARGTRLSPDGVQYLLAKHVAVARERCPALNKKRVTPHCLRHYLPFRTMSCTGTRALYLRQNSRSSSDIVLTHFHQLYAGGQATTAKCIIGNRVVCRERRKVSCSIFRSFARSLSEQRYKLGPIQQPTHCLPERPVGGTRLSRAMSGCFSRRDLIFAS